MAKDLHLRVALFGDYRRDHRREAFRGIADYLLENMAPPFTTDLLRQPPSHASIKRDYAGIITTLPVTAATRYDVPTIQIVTANLDNRRITHVLPDDEQAGIIGLQHLLEQGYEHVAFFGVRDVDYSQRRLRGFKKEAASHGMDVHVLDLPSTSVLQQDRDRDLPVLRDWIRQLPVSTGIMACQDYWARDLTKAAMLEQIQLPQDIGVLGVDNNELMCELVYPPLSSVDIDFYTVGYEAAALMTHMLQGRHKRSQVIKTPVQRVAGRLSTDRTSIYDPVTMAALRYITGNLSQPISVQDVADAVRISRRGLERLFNNHLGRTPHDQIQYQRLERAKRLLRSTRQSITSIAVQCGFSHPSNFSRTFSTVEGLTPRAYRKSGA